LVKARIKERVQHVGLVTITFSHSAIVRQDLDWLLVLVHEFDSFSRMPFGPLGLACGNNSALHNEA